MHGTEVIVNRHERLLRGLHLELNWRLEPVLSAAAHEIAIAVILLFLVRCLASFTVVYVLGVQLDPVLLSIVQLVYADMEVRDGSLSLASR